MQLVIHAGAAFTDEGRMSQSLQANWRVLSENGASSPRPRKFRREIEPVLQSLWTDSPTSELHAQVRKLIPTEPDITRMILTGEDFFGDKLMAIHEGQFYPFAGQWLAYVDRILQDTQIELFFALLNPGIFIPKVLLSLTESQRRHVIENTDLSCLSWLSVIEDIRDLAPNVKMTLWSNEDTPLIWGDILRAMGNLQDDVPLSDEYGLLTSLINSEGQREALTLARQKPPLSRKALRVELTRIFKDCAEPEKVEEEIDLPGWSDDVLNAFSELYEQDLSQIKGMPDVRFLTA